MRNNIYFFKDTLGLKSDIERHRSEEKRIRENIERLQSIENPSDMDEMMIKHYKICLGLVLKCKANITEKIGRK